MVEAHRHRPWIAALLSFLFPGLGQAYAGDRGMAAIFAAPMVLLIVTIAVALSGLSGDQTTSLLSTRFLIGVLVVNGALLLWRAAAVIHAAFASRAAPRMGSARRVTGGLVVILLLGIIGMHAWIGGVVIQLEGTLTQIFAQDDRRDQDPPAGAPDDDPDERAAATPAWDGRERINVLLLGTDAAPGREAVLTDVILVVSVDPVAETAVMISVPRDTGFLPMPDGRLFPDGYFPDKVNELATRASLDPHRWCPDASAEPQRCGLESLEASVGLYLGIEIHHYALVDMVGFSEMIDALGGIELCLPGRLVDPEFDGSLANRGPDEPLILPAGCHHYGGVEALAYTRSRKGWIEMPDGTTVPQTDFDRSERQQAVLLALRDELAEADTLFELPSLLGAIGRTISTDFPRDQAGDLASLLPLITGPSIDRLVLGYPEYVDLPANPGVNYLLVPKRDAIRDEMGALLAPDALRGWYLGSTADGPDGFSSSGAETP
jgi:LCP family protein required for cell wall assembly